ncbi:MULTISPECIES: efflux RND transporter permease subunit [Alkanindiges]|jgi:cobalt-zinc-cadmium resistance protein CzcA|uniref:CusA/CzcA family heavy metal efflux RND transporter n=1 Tax=Alkanindiges illinoisensis TaxID=197183 RepID=A0A4Y7XB14_9GAMM|nr:MULTISPECIES: CusA/CzcA family heavy metal efflux RND transporter [Alkanindiges]TEU25401.1 CusA/CzcA family heavy metal efflux RND transporter [Alkanindiges illinoisensis]
MDTKHNDSKDIQTVVLDKPEQQQQDSVENQIKIEGWFDRIIHTAIQLRGWVMLLVLGLVIIGVMSYQKLPIDAVPDITNVQVQINSAAPGFTALEAEQRITYPIERVMAGIPKLELTRSISRYGLSQVTIIFEDGTDIYWARQMISQRLQEAKSQMPEGIEPSMSPISTGLGEIYLWTLSAAPDAKKADGTAYTPADLRELQDWVVRPQLQRVPGVAEVNSIGGFAKQYLVQPDMNALQGYDLSIEDIRIALSLNNENRGAGFIDLNGQQLTVRVPGQLGSLLDIGAVVVSQKNGIPIKVSDVATVSIGHDLRTGAATMNGQETVLGTAMMMMGANSRVVSQAVDEKIQEVKRSLPKGVVLDTVYNRTTLVDKAIATVQKNLIEGAILVIAVLFLFLGNIRAAIITACVIPLSMLFTLTGMVQQQISANLMSLGALDFGIIIDGAVVIVENCIRRLAEEQHRQGRLLTRQERFTQVFLAAKQARRPLIFGQLIILVVYLPIFALTGVEAKLFHPMAMTVVIALIGAMILSVTFVPAAVALFITGKVEEKENRIMLTLKRWYLSALNSAYAFKQVMVVAALAILLLTGLMATKLGSEFAPTLSEGDFALQSMRSPSTSLEESLRMQERMEAALLKQFPEIERIFARTGTAEVATDVMPPNISDGYIMLKPKSEWPDQKETLPELRERLQEVVEHQVGAVSEFSQPIQLRFNELISGIRSDVGVKIFGDDMQVLNQQAEIIAAKLRQINGAADVKVEQTSGLPLLTVEIKRDAAALYGLSSQQIQDTVAAAIGGTVAGQILQGDRRFDLVIRQSDQMRNPEQLAQLPIRLNTGGVVALSQVADVRMVLGINQMSRENGKRRVVVTTNVNGRDLGSFVSDLQATVSEVQLPAGYWVDYGGQFENLQSATKRMQIVVPVALLLVFALLIAVFNNLRDSVLVFSGVPFALTGGVVALWLRDIPFSMSAGVGFIALSGVAVLNGLVMLSFIRELRDTGLSVYQATWQGAILRLRPVLMTAFVASLGFVPMALATGTGAEVQRPLATVVIGGIISSTLLTLLFLPVVYRWLNSRADKLNGMQDKPEMDVLQMEGHSSG